MSLAEKIAEYMVEEGTKKTSTGNWIFYYSELNERFSVNLRKDNILLIELIVALFEHNSIIDFEVDSNEECIDIIFGLCYCDNLEDPWEAFIDDK